MQSQLTLGGVTLRSRLIVGTGKYPTPDITRAAIEASGADMVTVAIGRVKLDERGESNLIDQLDWSRYTILPNTAGAYSAKDAVRIAVWLAASGAVSLVAGWSFPGYALVMFAVLYALAHVAPQHGPDA